MFATILLTLDDQAIYSNKLTGGGGCHSDPPRRFSKRSQIKDQALACK